MPGSGAISFCVSGCGHSGQNLSGFIGHFLHDIKGLCAMITAFSAAGLILINWHSFHHGDLSCVRIGLICITSQPRDSDILYHGIAQIVKNKFLIRGLTMSLSGKTILITGAAGGLGAALALQCAKAGAELVLLDKDRRGLNQLSDKITDQDLASPGLYPMGSRRCRVG